jgi:hypothetical protein
VAIGAVKLQLVTSDCYFVTAETVGSVYIIPRKPLKNCLQNRILGSYRPLTPRGFTKCPSIRKTAGRGGGVLAHSSKQLAF